ncbi:MAG: putative 4-hydroxybenzoate polyprenyltransferase [Calditrichaeota bacterium]|nr:putative 4-hydroxybenzoate polyprenyltransferase [Calditrichota bacterium]
MNKLVQFGRMIKFSHTIFALPFALSSAILAIQYAEFKWTSFIWILLAMIGARTAAMSFNRYIDADIDRENPRTANREIPSGKITKSDALIYVILSSLLLIFSAYRLNLLCFYLSPVALIVILGYSYLKRFTWLCHVVLGIGLGISPVGAWIAITGTFSVLPVLIGLAIMFWVAGFDIIYACQDFEFDSKRKLHSIPVTFGIERSLSMAKLFHTIAFLLFLAPVYVHEFHWIYFIGIAFMAGFLVNEHLLLRQRDLSKVNLAFFNMNAYFSIVYFSTICIDYYLKQAGISG